VLVDLVGRFAEQKNATPAQIALAWILAQKPGADLKQVDEAASILKLEGARLPEAVLKMSGL